MGSTDIVVAKKEKLPIRSEKISHTLRVFVAMFEITRCVFRLRCNPKRLRLRFGSIHTIDHCCGHKFILITVDRSIG